MGELGRDTMKAVVWYDYGEKKIEIRELSVPEVGDDDVLLKVRAAAICGGDIRIWHGKSDHERNEDNRPVIVGHEFMGEIVKKGARVDSRWQIGDRVVSENTAYACGICPACQRGDYVNCGSRKTLGVTADGGFAEYVRIPGEILRLYPTCIMKVPDTISDEEAACLEVCANAYKSLIQDGEFHSGESVVILGTGPFGLNCIQHAQVAGATNIIVVTHRSTEKTRLELARQYGATEIFFTEKEDEAVIVGKIQEIVGNNGVAVVIDTVAVPEVTQMAIDVVRNEGIIVFVGDNNRPFGHKLMPLAKKQITMRGHTGYNAESWRNTIALAAAGKIDLKQIITKVIPLSSWKEGYELLEGKNKPGKIVLIPGLEK